MPSVIQLNPRFRLDPRYMSQERGDGARDDLDEKKTKQGLPSASFTVLHGETGFNRFAAASMFY